MPPTMIAQQQYRSDNTNANGIPQTTKVFCTTCQKDVYTVIEEKAG